MAQENAYRLLSVEQAAEALQISPWTVRKHLARANIKATRIGTRVLIPSEEIARIAAQGLPSLRVEEPLSGPEA